LLLPTIIPAAKNIPCSQISFLLHAGHQSKYHLSQEPLIFLMHCRLTLQYCPYPQTEWHDAAVSLKAEQHSPLSLPFFLSIS